MREGVIRAGVLTIVFLVATVVFSVITNRGNADMAVEMDSATFPTISFDAQGYGVNSLVGYKNEMYIPAMRDTVTPLDENGEVEVRINLYDSKIQSLTYELYTLDGKKRLFQKKENTVEDTMTFRFGDILQKNIEGVLKITLDTEDEQKIHYYTRVVKPDGYYIKECMDFAHNLHTEMLAKLDTGDIVSVIEPSDEADNTTLQHVTIHSDLEHITWGNLKPEIVGDIRCDLKEMNSAYTAVQFRYQVKCPGDDNEEELYNVKEFFRVRYLRGTLYLLDYDRTMNQVFDASKQVLSGKGIQLGIVPKNMQYEISGDGTIAAFIQERALWCYDRSEDAFSLVFSFEDSERQDIRNCYDQHAIRIISMEKSGNMTFAVYGYMNRGTHEGEVGAAIYYFNISQNMVEEKAFIPSNKSFAIAEEELGKLVYYNNKQNMIYVLVDGGLYRVNLKEREKEEVVNGLGGGQYVASNDGRFLAYQKDGSLTDSTEIILLDFLSGKNQSISVQDGERIRPLGFLADDFVYGILRPEDAGKTVSGEDIVPMHRLEIRDMENKIVKTYQSENTYISDVFIEGNMITLNRMTRNGEVYMAINRDYITNNGEKKESNISLKQYVTTLKETQYCLAYEDGIEDQKPKLRKPKQMLVENPTTVAFDSTDETGYFYVYGLGEMIGLYEHAGYAVQKADEMSAVVISSRQSYVWERGNRDLRYFNSAIDKFTAQEGETTLAACIRQILAYEGQEVDVTGEMQAGKSPLDLLNEYSGGEAMDLTGCTAEEMLYIIGKGTPVIAMTDSSNAVLLVGYDPAVIDYLDPADGALKNSTAAGIDAMTDGSGHTFIGYVKPQKYE